MQKAAEVQVAAGYQQSELGLIPSDWKVTEMGRLGQFGRGRVISHNEINKARHKAYPVYSSQTSNEGIMGYIDTFDFSGTYVTWTTDGVNAGKVFFRDGQFNCTNVCGVIKVEQEDPRYVALAMDAEARKYVSTNLANPKLMNGVAKKVLVRLPNSKQEQTAIADALSDVDALIAGQEKLITKKQAIKTATMQQLLTGKIRLPQFAHYPDDSAGSYKKTELGFIPSGWGIFPLGDLLNGKPKYGINAAAVPLSNGLPVYIRITDISEDGRFSPETKVGVNSPFSDLYQLAEGDLVLARTGASVGKSYLYRKEDGMLVYAGFLIKISPGQSKLDPRFLFQFLQTDQYWSWVAVHSMRSGQPGINGNEYGSLPVICPPLAEQTAIATILTDMDNEIEALQQRLTKTRQIKQGMMQELLTGKTRLPFTDTAA